MFGSTESEFSFRKRYKLLIGATLSLSIVSISISASAPTASAAIPSSGIYIKATDNIAPGKTLDVIGQNWASISNATYQWYRCDLPNDGIEKTSNSINPPSECSAIAGSTSNSYTISSITQDNPDEGKYITVIATEDTGGGTFQRAMAKTTANFVVLNESGGNNSSDGLRLIFSNGSIMPIRNGLNQIYDDDNSNNSGSAFPLIWAENVLISPEANDGTGSYWVRKSDSRDAEWGAAVTEKTLDTGTEFRARSIFSKNFGGKTYELVMEITYLKPNQNVDVKLSLTVPQSASHSVQMYYAMDMFLDGNDFGPGFTNLIGENRLIAQKNGTAYGGVVEIEGSEFTSWLESGYEFIFGRNNNVYGPGNNDPSYPSVIEPNPNTDAGVGVHWNLGQAPGTFEKKFKLSFADSRKPSINSGYSQSDVKANREVFTNITILNIAANSINDLNIKVLLPAATYSDPSSNCDINPSILTQNGAQFLVIENQNIVTTTDSCSVDIPTIFSSEGVKSIDSTDLVTNVWDDAGISSTFSNVLGSEILVSSASRDTQVYKSCSPAAQTLNSDEKVLSFTNVETDCLWKVPSGVSQIQTLLVGGGGGGGGDAGGGGAGGAVLSNVLNVSQNQILRIMVGRGGIGGGGASNGQSGQASQVDHAGIRYVATGGLFGYTCGYNGSICTTNAGGTNGTQFGSGGNGALHLSDSTFPSNGLSGVASSISGNDIVYGSGGGGGGGAGGLHCVPGLGGTDSGGKGFDCSVSPNTSATNGMENTGGGGGGGGDGGNGGSGVFIMRFFQENLNPTPSPTPTPSPSPSSTAVASTCKAGLVGRIQFASDKDKLSKANKIKLSKLARSFKNSGCSKIKIIGYTSQTVSNPSKLNKEVRARLSKARAKAVEKHLKGQLKKSAQLVIEGRSERDPISANTSEKTRKPNRRVDVWFY